MSNTTELASLSRRGFLKGAGVTAVSTALLENGLRFVTAAPIEVEGRLWGAMLALESEREALPAGVVNRLESFTELVATAVANATARSELVAARRRVIEAGDAARERLTRDIHDGAQQQFANSLQQHRPLNRLGKKMRRPHVRQ